LNQPAPIVVIGIGNTMRHDDGIGPAAVAELQAFGDDRAMVEHLTLDGESTRLLEAWGGRDLAIIIDALRSGSEPGQVRRLELGRDELPTPPPGVSSHRSGLAEAVDLGRALDRLPNQLVVFGVEAVDLSPGQGLSRPVAAALPALVATVRAELPLIPPVT